MREFFEQVHKSGTFFPFSYAMGPVYHLACAFYWFSFYCKITIALYVPEGVLANLVISLTKITDIYMSIILVGGRWLMFWLPNIEDYKICYPL